MKAKYLCVGCEDMAGISHDQLEKVLLLVISLELLSNKNNQSVAENDRLFHFA